MSFISMLFGSKTSPNNVAILNKEQYAREIKKGRVQLVDVRTAREFRGGHIKGAKNFDFFSQQQFTSGFETLDKSKPVYIYCQSGNRSRKAANRLVALGFESIVDLAGGYNNWLR